MAFLMGIPTTWCLSAVVLPAICPAAAAQSSPEERRPSDPIVVEEALPTELGEFEVRATLDTGRERVNRTAVPDVLWAGFVEGIFAV